MKTGRAAPLPAFGKRWALVEATGGLVVASDAGTATEVAGIAAGMKSRSASALTTLGVGIAAVPDASSLVVASDARAATEIAAIP